MLGCSNTKPANPDCYKGRLEIKGICANYTIKLLEGQLPEGTIAANWTDESTGKQYTNVFSLENPCVLPGNMNEGQEFYFTVVREKDRDDCVTCMAYYPKPDKKLNIKVLADACR